MRFSQARTVEPLTNPSLCSMFTSLYPHEHGATRNGLRLRPDAGSAVRVLERRGYRTAAFVGNWTLRNSVARSEVQVSVSYDSDPKQVMDILLELARNHPLVLTMPEPNVGFQAFGQYSMDFELRFHVADIFQGGPTRNDIRVAIIERFREEGIEIPLPQRELNVRVKDRPEERALEEALADEGLPADVIRRVVERAEHKAPRRGRKVDLADDNDGSPFDGMHHALRDDGDADGDGVDDADETR